MSDAAVRGDHPTAALILKPRNMKLFELKLTPHDLPASSTKAHSADMARKTKNTAKKFLQRKLGQLAWLKAQGNDFLEELAVHVAQFDDHLQQDFEEEMIRLLPEYPKCFVTYFVRNIIGKDARTHRLRLADDGFVEAHLSVAN